jgi:ribosome-associated protein
VLDLCDFLPTENKRLKTLEFAIRGEHIALDALLKATGLASSGAVAKLMVQSGLVQVDQKTELRRSCKMRAGQTVVARSVCVRLIAEEP